MPEFYESKMYEVQLQDEFGAVLSSQQIEASSGDAAVRQLDGVVNGTEKIIVLADGECVSEMEREFWQKRVRRR